MIYFYSGVNKFKSKFLIPPFLLIFLLFIPYLFFNKLFYADYNSTNDIF